MNQNDKRWTYGILAIVTMIGLGFILFIVAVRASAQSIRPKAEYKVLRINQTQVGIACQNGADPTGIKLGQLLIISCGK